MRSRPNSSASASPAPAIPAMSSTIGGGVCIPSMRFSAMPMLARVVAERAPASYHSLMRAMSSMLCTGHDQPRTALISPDSLRMC